MRRIVMPCFIIGLVTSAAAGEQPAGLVRNEGFETAGDKGLPANWSGPTNVYSRDATVAHSGQASLKFVNDNPEHYALCSQRVELESGRMYEFSGWVKAKGIQGKDSGATICMEWQDTGGKYLGGSYVPGSVGESDWTLIKGVTSRIPPEAKRFSLTCYVRKGMTGTAWWDDLRVERYREPPLATVLRVPNYRGQITDAGPKRIEIRCELELADFDLTPKDVAIGWSVVREKDKVEVSRGLKEDVAEAATDLCIPAEGLVPGGYAVELILTQKGAGRTLANRAHRVVRVAGAPKRIATIDSYNRLILNGEPFFPLGMYWSGISKDELEVYAKSGFNCLMPYGQPSKEQMDLAHSLGLKVIYTVKDIYSGTRWAPASIKTESDELAHIKQKVEAFGKHPALMAWYINDELPVSMIKRLAQHRQWLEDLDPDHPTWVVLYQVDQVRRYIESFDVIGTDPYPIPKRPASMAGDWTRKTVQGVAGARAVWQVPQVFNWADYKKDPKEQQEYRPPTFEEMRSMAWQCIAEGANGLIFYSWFDIRHRDKVRPFEESWGLVKRIAGEVKEMMPALLSVEATPEVKVEGAKWLHWTVRQVGATTVLITVNDGREPGSVKFSLPRKPAKVVLRGSQEAVAVDGTNALTVRLEPLGVGIYELAGLVGK
ncbi:MAG: hypothetical protein JXQ73_16955 [Phycisphaerae bacterium]|nr:hypothetical protein [Phycisphaerae bacterium]